MWVGRDRGGARELASGVWEASEEMSKAGGGPDPFPPLHHGPRHLLFFFVGDQGAGG